MIVNRLLSLMGIANLILHIEMIDGFLAGGATRGISSILSSRCAPSRDAAAMTSSVGSSFLLPYCAQKQQRSSHKRAISRLYGMPKEFRPSDDDEDASGANDEESQQSYDVDMDRQRLEAIFGEPSSLVVTDTPSNDDRVHDEAFVRQLIDPNIEVKLPKHPPMTSIDKDRRMTEMQLLTHLRDSDEASDGLWQLWFFERGPKARQQMDEADQLMTSGDPRMWLQCEVMLMDLIKEYGVYWVEPVNRLATLYFLQGRYEQAYKLCKVVLEIKPWHFGALSGIVMVCINMGERDEARMWAGRRLPSMVASSSFPPFEEKEGPSNPRRLEWVERAVRNAHMALKRAERQTKESFGSPEDYYDSDFNKESKPSKRNILDIDSDSDGGSSDSWQ